MATFPISEAEVVKLAKRIGEGITAHPEDFPSPPVAKTDIDEILTSLTGIENVITTHKSELQGAMEEKLAALTSLVEAMKKDIKFAETLYPNDNEKLTLIGWGARKEKTPTPAPGAAQNLTANPQGEGWLLLDWEKPLEGGKPAAYKVMRRKREIGTWENVGTATDCSIELGNQERKVEWEYCIIATNKAGDAPQSNIVMAVL